MVVNVAPVPTVSVRVLCVPVKLVTTPVTARRFDPASRSVASTLPTTFSTFDPNVKLALSTNSLEDPTKGTRVAVKLLMMGVPVMVRPVALVSTFLILL